MKRTKKLLLLFLFFCLFLTGCTAATQENMDSAENNYTELTLFSDVSFWNPPVWSFEEGTKEDIAQVAAIYDHILTEEEEGRAVIGWIRGV